MHKIEVISAQSNRQLPVYRVVAKTFGNEMAHFYTFPSGVLCILRSFILCQQEKMLDRECCPTAFRHGDCTPCAAKAAAVFGLIACKRVWQTVRSQQFWRLDINRSSVWSKTYGGCTVLRTPHDWQDTTAVKTLYNILKRFITPQACLSLHETCFAPMAQNEYAKHAQTKAFHLKYEKVRCCDAFDKEDTFAIFSKRK